MATLQTQTTNEAAAPADDGLFGPDSVTWHVMSAPATAIGAGAAALVQMLVPRVMWMIDQASNVWQYPHERGEKTGEYEVTTVYGDTAAAEQAGAALRGIHRVKHAVDPQTGERYAADQPDLLLWVHCTIPWMLLRAYRRWGPTLTAPEEDRFIDEQRIAARLVGVDPAIVPGNFAALNAYMESMRPKLAATVGCRRLLALTSAPFKPTAPGMIAWTFSRATIDLMTAEQRSLYGIRWSRLDHLTTDATTRAVIRMATAKVPYTQALPQMRTNAIAHAFGGHKRVVAGGDATRRASPSGATPRG